MEQETRLRQIREALPQVINEGDAKRIVRGFQNEGGPETFFNHLLALRTVDAAVGDRMTPKAREYFNRQMEALVDLVESK